MAQVDVIINGQNYRIACDEGQQDHLRRLAVSVDNRISELVSVMGQIGDLRLLVMTAMLMADELDELRSVASGDEAERPATGGGDAAAEAALATGIEALAKRVETVAAHIEQA